jgi:hypothetical protein
MSPGSFEERRAAEWVELDRLITSVEKGKPVEGVDELPRRFREACSDLALARHRMYAGHLIDRLNTLVIRGYKLLYRSRKHGWQAALKFAVAGFPQTIRKEWRLFWLCNALFWIPFFAMMASAWFDIDWIRSAIGQEADQFPAEGVRLELHDVRLLHPQQCRHRLPDFRRRDRRVCGHDLFPDLQWRPHRSLGGIRPLCLQSGVVLDLRGGALVV